MHSPRMRTATSESRDTSRRAWKVVVFIGAPRSIALTLQSAPPPRHVRGVEDSAMAWLSDPQAWIALLTLTVLEIVLGIDNVIFISILSGKLPIEQQKKARTIGLSM